MNLLEFTFQSFWHFAGMFLLIFLILRVPLHAWAFFIRHLNIRSKGWPPSHLDADGDFEPKPEEDE